jgi:transposase-like protein
MKPCIERLPETKQCPICSQDLPLTEYGICRARKDGRNLYCKSCIRKKVSESRRAFKAYKSVRHQYVVQKAESGEGPDGAENTLPARRQYVTRQISKMTPAERVREAIKNGARTQKEIAQGTKLGKDEIGDALANLLLWTREVRTETIDNNRVYFINEGTPDRVFFREEAAPSKPAAQRGFPAEDPALPPRKRDVPSSFSALQDLMPGKKSEGEPERAPGWVAA